MPSKLSSQLNFDPNSSKGNLGDFSHASRLFVDADLRLAPKVKFLYHVVFGINTDALITSGFKYKHQTELNMLVKKVDLPAFSLETGTLNQYNRKKTYQTKIAYQPINLTFHDDGYGVTRKLWENYYQYYYADSKSAEIFNSYDPRNSTKSGKLILSPYGLNNGSTKPFFKNITVYQLTKGEWNSFTLINPMITQWKHDSLNYSESAPVEHTLTLIFESVVYNSGTGKPPLFAQEHYDTAHSPLILSASSPKTTTSVSDISQTSMPVQSVNKSEVISQALAQGKKTVGSTPEQQVQVPSVNKVHWPGKNNI